MKCKVLLVLTLICCSTFVMAQEFTCEPDTTLLSDTVLISPLPFEPTLNPEGGIPDTACLNVPYETIFSLRMPDSIPLFGVQTAIDRIEFSTVNSISGLPDGVSYACNPPNCVFEAGVTGCLVISGTPDNEANLGQNPLTFSGRIILESGFFQDVSFPDTGGFLPESFMGEYSITVKSEPLGNEACTIVSADFIRQNISVINSPNPFSGFTHIRINSQVNELLEFRVSDFMGRQVHNQVVNIINGNNTLFFNGENLPQGMYIYTLSNEKGKVSGKMLIARR